MRNSIGHKTKNIEQLEKEIEAKKQTLAVVHNLLLNEAKAEAHGVGIDQNNIYSRRYSSIVGSSKYNGKSSKRNQTSKETRSYQKRPNNIHQNGSTRSMPLNAKQEMRNLNVQSNEKTEICYNCTKQQLLTRDMIRIITHLSCLSDEALANERYFAKIFFYNMSREEPEPYKSKSLTAAVDNCQLILNSLKNKIGQRVNDLLTMEYWCTDNIDVQIKDLTSFYLDTSVFGTIYENSQDYLKNKANTQKSKFVKDNIVNI
ncbi:hypothetical protein BDF19DRAFT_428629 [Syncephalis fuscata]|nr:hypothetical protein BDF19DRAFT_428629 [Syncephalis fuscata]